MLKHTVAVQAENVWDTKTVIYTVHIMNFSTCMDYSGEWKVPGGTIFWMERLQTIELYEWWLLITEHSIKYYDYYHGKLWNASHTCMQTLYSEVFASFDMYPAVAKVWVMHACSIQHKGFELFNNIQGCLDTCYWFLQLYW